MNPRLLIALAVALGALNVAAAVTVGLEHLKDSEPVMLALFTVPWLVGAELVRRGRLVAGAVVLSLMSLMVIVSAPGWKHGGAADLAEQIASAVGAAGCLAVAVTLIVRRHRGSAVTAGATS